MVSGDKFQYRPRPLIRDSFVGSKSNIFWLRKKNALESLDITKLFLIVDCASKTLKPFVWICACS